MKGIRQLVLDHQDITVVTLALALTTFTMGLMQPVLPLYAQSLGASVEQWGLIASMWGIAMAIGETFWGWFHDYVDRVAPLFFRMISATIVFLALSLPATSWPLFFLNFWRGFGDAASWPTGRSFVSRAASPARVALAMGILGTGARLGGALGALVSGQVANAYGYKPTFYLSAVVSLSVALLIVPRFGWPRLRARRKASGIPPSSPSLRISVKRYRSVLRSNRPFVVLAGITIVASVGWFGPYTFLPFIVTSSMQGTVADVGLMFNISSIVMAALIIPLGGVGDRVGRRTLVISGLAVSALQLVGVAFAGTFPHLVALVAVGAIGQAATRPSLDALVSDTASSEARGRMMGVYGTCEDLGGIIGPILGSLMWRMGGAPATFITFAALGGLGCILAATVIKERSNASEGLLNKELSHD